MVMQLHAGAPENTYDRPRAKPYVIVIDSTGIHNSVHLRFNVVKLDP